MYDPVSTLHPLRMDEQGDITGRELRQVIAAADGAVFFDGLDNAIVGVGTQHTRPAVLVYSARRIVELLMSRDGMDRDEAEDFYAHNIECLWAGDRTPLILHDWDT
jgi:hypothetical protein